MPCSGPLQWFALRSLSTRAAWSSARSGVGCSNALKRALNFSMRSRNPFVSSTDVSRPARISGESSSMVANQTSLLSMSAPLLRRAHRLEHHRQVAAGWERVGTERLQGRERAGLLAFELLL